MKKLIKYMFIIVGADFCDQNDVLHNLGTPLRVCVVKTTI